jgi:uncharacterized protein
MPIAAGSAGVIYGEPGLTVGPKSDRSVVQLGTEILEQEMNSGLTGSDECVRPIASMSLVAGHKFFWDGVNAHELRIPKRADGGQQHPPVPAIWQDNQAPIDYAVASGTGTVFSFVVHHALRVPGRTLLCCHRARRTRGGVRVLGELRNVDPTNVEIGMPVRATYIDFPAHDVGPAWTLYAWEPDA